MITICLLFLNVETFNYTTFIAPLSNFLSTLSQPISLLPFFVACITMSADYDINQGNNINCKCMFWQYYYNNGKVIIGMECITHYTFRKQVVPQPHTFEFQKYIFCYGYGSNVWFIVCIFDDVLKRLKISSNTWQWIDNRNICVTNSKGRYHQSRMTDICCSFNKKSLKCGRKYIYNGFNFTCLRFEFYNRVYNSKCRDMIDIKKSTISCVNFDSMQYYMRRSGNPEMKDIEINV